MQEEHGAPARRCCELHRVSLGDLVKLPSGCLVAVLLSFVVGLGGSVSATAFWTHNRPIGQISTWARFDALRDAACWGFLAAKPGAALQLLQSQRLELERCIENTANSYPCHGRVIVEVALRLAALAEVEGNTVESELWVRRAITECTGSSKTPCSRTVIERAVDRLVRDRRQGGEAAAQP